MASGTKRGIGRGLSAILPDTSAAGDAGELRELPVDLVKPNPGQPRTKFDQEALDALAESIEASGIVQPLLVRPLPDGSYELVAGERRWRAAQQAGLKKVPAVIRDQAEADRLQAALIENMVREDLNPVEEARAYQRLGERDDMPQVEIARLVGKSRSHVANMQRLLTLPAAVLDHLAAGRLDMGHARALVGRDDAEALAERAVAQKLSVREVERLARRAPGEPGARRPARQARDSSGDADIIAVQNHLEEFLGLPVRIAADTDPRSGAVTIRYRTLDQLDLICQRLTGGGI